MKGKSLYEKIFSVIIALVLWQLAAMVLKQELLLVTPIKVIARLFELIFIKDFWTAIFFSLIRILAGFFLALIIGTLLAIASSSYHLLEVILWPFLSVIKATPVASFVILCLIWLNSGNLPIFISFLMVLPVIYTNILQGIKSTDKKLLEMAQVFSLRSTSKIKYIYMPQLRPYIQSACSISLGLCWKAGIAAEVIGIPEGSIGEMLYEAKIYLNSKDLFAWTVVIIIISIVFEKFFSWAIKALYGILERG